MPRVVENQRAKFETDTVLRQLQEDSEYILTFPEYRVYWCLANLHEKAGNEIIRYTGHADCHLEEKRLHLRTDCHEGSCQIGFVGNGVHLILTFPKNTGSRYTSSEFVDFTREAGKVYITCPLIFNGVCVRFFGYLDLQTLTGVGHLEFDESTAQAEHRLMVETLQLKNRDRNLSGSN